MRHVFALLAVLALLISPVTAVAAQQACAQAAPDMMAGMQMSSAQTDHAGQASADPCCDHGKKAPAGDNKACAQACASMCAVSAALPVQILGVPVFRSTLAYATKVDALRAHSVPRAERPPKLIS